MALIQKAFSDIITFSRSSNATRVGPNGLVQYAPHNLILQSQTFDTASWTKGNSSVSANAAAAPDGTVTADKLVENSLTALHYTGSTVVSITSGTVITISVYAKAGERTRFGLLEGYTNKGAFFDLSAGTVIGNFLGAPISSAIQSLGNGWYRCSVTTTTSTSADCEVYLVSTGTTYNYTGDGTSGLYIWGAQLAVGPLPLDYTPTTTAAVYGPRFDYDGSGVTSVDPIATNLLLYSEQFNNAAWTADNVIKTADTTTSPDGTVNADSITESATTSNHRTYQALSKAASAITYTASVYAKTNGRNMRLHFDGGTVGNSVSAGFNLSAGTISVAATATGTFSGASATITPVGNGWYRCTVTGTTGTETTVRPNIFVLNGTTDNYAGDGTSGIYVWGAQLEIGSTATGYMVSGATNGFRAVPVVTGNATARGLLVEEARTNLLTYSEDYSNAAWTKTNSTVTANSATSPDGTVTADLISGTGAGQVITQTVTANGTQQTLSFFVKKPSSGVFSGATLLFYNLTTTSVIGLAKFSGETFTVNATTGTGTSTAYGNGWYRITLTNSSGLSSGNLLICYLYPDNLAGASIANDTVLAWGAQCE